MSEPVRRVNYFFGQLLTVDDLRAEQTYHRDMRYLHNRLHGRGVVEGFDVSAGDDHGDEGHGEEAGHSVVVTPGLAIDPYGREIILVAEVRVDVGPDVLEPDSPADVVAVWQEVPDAPVPRPDGCGTDFARWVERPRLTIEPVGGASTEGLVLARLVRVGGRVADVDCSVREVLGGACGTTAD